MLLALLVLAGCGSTPPKEEGRIIYKAESEKAHVRSSLLLTTQPQVARIEEAAPALRQSSNEAEVHVTPEELGKALARLDAEGFFTLPGSHGVPQTQAPRSITVDVASRKFYIPFQDLRDEGEIARYGRAARILISASLAGPHDRIPKPAK